MGSHPITAVYNGDANYVGSTSTPALNQVVNTAATTTRVVSSANPSVFGQSVTFTATVASTFGALVPAGETVTFMDGATTLGTGMTNGVGVATFTTSTLAVGIHSITTVYGGDLNFTGNTSSPALTQIVNKAATTTTLVSSVNPSAFGQSVTFTATLSSAFGAAIPNGETVTFKDGATALGTATVNSGVATFAISTLIVGTHPITAVYGGDANFLTSTSAPVLNQVVTKPGTTTTLTSSPNPSAFGQAVTFTATVSSAFGTVPAGEIVTFKDGAITLGTGMLNGSGMATFTISTLTVGNHPITAVYSTAMRANVVAAPPRR